MKDRHARSKAWLAVLMLVCLAGTAFSVVSLGGYAIQSCQGRASYQALSQAAMPGVAAPQQNTTTPSSSAVQGVEGQALLPNFTYLENVNPQIKAWVWLANSPISYPVVQCANNEYYLHHLFDQTPNSSGCPFIDARNAAPFQDPNTIIYGHNMYDGTMFSALSSYSDPEYAAGHPVFTIWLSGSMLEVQVIAAYTADPQTDAFPWQLNLTTTEQMESWLAQTLGRSQIEFNGQAAITDRFVTFSTCSAQNSTKRFLVVGKIVESPQ